MDKIIVHPSYSPSSSNVQNNLALWKLSVPVSTSVYSTVCLPTQGTEQVGEATLVGWRISELVGELPLLSNNHNLTSYHRSLARISLPDTYPV